MKIALIAGATLVLGLATGCTQPSGMGVISSFQAVNLPADGISEARLALPEFRDRASWRAVVLGGSGHGQVSFDESAAPVLVYRAGVLPGESHILLTGPLSRTATLTVKLTPDFNDLYEDGIPEFYRLHSASDRQSFRSRFTWMAEREAFMTKQSPEISDCAALLRYCYRESVRRHDDQWARDMGGAAIVAQGDIAQYTFPYTPLGPKLFRTHEGTFVPADLTDGTFAEFADARSLMLANSHLVSRDVRHARPGDLLFYLQPDQQSPFHSMIFVGGSTFGPGTDWVVYHTGRDGRWRGEIRRVSLAFLVNHPDPRWRPLACNPKFLGVYRWNILREDD